MLCYNYGEIDWLSQTAISRTVSLAIALPVALLTGSIAVPKALRVRAAGAGVLELAGLMPLTITFALGPATVAGVTTTQFGTFAVILGFVLLHERPSPTSGPASRAPSSASACWRRSSNPCLRVGAGAARRSPARVHPVDCPHTFRGPGPAPADAAPSPAVQGAHPRWQPISSTTAT